MRTPFLKTLTVFSLAVLLVSTLSAFAAPPASARSKIWEFRTTLKPGVSSGFYLGPATNGTAYIVDITPLQKSSNGAYVKSVVQPEYDGEQWNDILRVMLPPEFPKLRVLISVYRPSGLETVTDWTDSFPPGEWRGYPIASIKQYEGPYLVDLDPLEASVDGATIQRTLVHPEYPGSEWLDILRVQTAEWLPSKPLPIRMRVYLAPNLPLVADFILTLTPADTWSGFVIGPASLKRGYLVRATPFQESVVSADLNQYIIQPEFDGKNWNDVLRIEMRNSGWSEFHLHLQVYACDKNSCP